MENMTFAKQPAIKLQPQDACSGPTCFNEWLQYNAATASPRLHIVTM